MLKLTTTERKNIKLNVFITDSLVAVLEQRHKKIEVNLLDDCRMITLKCGIMNFIVYSVNSTTFIQTYNKVFVVKSFRDLKKIFAYVK